MIFKLEFEGNNYYSKKYKIKIICYNVVYIKDL